MRLLYCKFLFTESQIWSLVTPHGGVSPPARSAATVVVLSAFTLPFLPPQMVNSTETPTQTSNTNTCTTVDELRPHSSPSVTNNEKTTPSNERNNRQLSFSSDSLYQPANIPYTDKRSSASSVDSFGTNIISYTNVSYSSSSEWKFGENDTYPLHKTLRDRCHSLERHEEESPQNEAHERASEDTTREDQRLRDKTRAGQNVVFSQPKEGLCIFVIGGKYCGSHDCFAKGMDVWRCDVTKRKYSIFWTSILFILVQLHAVVIIQLNAFLWNIFCGHMTGFLLTGSVMKRLPHNF